MAIYVVMEPGGRADAAAGGAAFVRDGWHFFAFLVPFAWFLWHRMWIEAALAIGAALLLAALDAQGGFTLVATGLSLLIAIYAGLEAPALRIAALRRRGWREAAVVEAGSSADAVAQAGMAQMSEKFRQMGGEVYLDAEKVKASNRAL